MTSGDISGYIVLYLTTARSHIVAISLLLASSGSIDMEEIFRHVHSLKGSSDVMGQDSISVICEQLISLIRPKQNIQKADEQSILKIKALVNELDEKLKKLESEKIGETTTT